MKNKYFLRPSPNLTSPAIKHLRPSPSGRGKEGEGFGLFLKFGIGILFGFWILSLGFSADAGTTIDPSRTLFTGRVLGMGGAHLGYSNDGEGIFVNPAGLTNIKFPQMVGVSRKLFLDETSYSIIGWAMPTDYGTFGLGYVGASVGGSYPTLRDPATDRITINPSLEAMSYENSVILLTYARKLPWHNISLGGNLKFFNQSIKGGGISDRATAMNLDLTSTYKPLHFLTLGAALQNVLGGSVSWAEGGYEDTLGGYWKFGGALNLLGSKKEALYESPQNVSVGLDVDLPQNVLNGSSLYHLGVEYMPIKFIALRAGLNQDMGGTGMTFGVGFRHTAFRFDYAYAPRPGITGDNPHYFSLSYIGDRVVSVKKKLMTKEGAINVITPKDRTITPDRIVKLIIEPKTKLIQEQITTWTVPAISSTSEVKEVYEYEDLANLAKNGFLLDKVGTIETTQTLAYGRNVISLTGTIVPEGIPASREVRVLRFKPMDDLSMKHWAIRPIVLCNTLGLIKGYPDNTFKPEKGITRAELTTLLVRTLNITASEWIEAAKESLFTDVEEGAWYAPYINLGVKFGLVTGYPDGTFKPNRVINRAEGVTLLARFAKLPEKEGVVFPDLEPRFWANKYIRPAKEAGMLKYLEGKKFEHKQDFTRAEAAEVLYRSEPIQYKVNEFWNTGRITEPTKPPKIEKVEVKEPTTKEASSE